MKETKIGYCGSKSIKTIFIVKEQRVDGSLSLNLQLRDIKCTLMGFEKNYQIRILSNQINLRGTRLFTSKAQLVNPCFEKHNFDTPLNPLALSGFIDPTRKILICVRNYAIIKKNIPITYLVV
jgi:hypothetical protein